jgi:hypothetical protein
MTLQDVLMGAINPHIARVLQYAQAALPESQFRAYRGLVLDEFGRKGMESELVRIVAEHERRNGKESGRPIHAGKEVPHD